MCMNQTETCKISKAENGFNSKGETDKCTNVIENFKTLPQQQKSSKGIEELTTTKDLTDIYRILHSTSQKTHSIHVSMEHMPRQVIYWALHTAGSPNLKERKSHSVSSNQNEIKLETKNRKIIGKSSNIWKRNNSILINP